MMARLLMLVRREFWEHRSLVVAPIVVAGLIFLGVLLAMVTAGIQTGFGAEGVVAGLNMTPSGGTSTGLNTLLLMPLGLMNVVLFFTVFFYCLDALYAERKDRSVLFWRSLPVTDTETVISKFATAAVAAPLLVFAIVALLQIAIIVALAVFVVMGGGSAWKLIWEPLSLTRVFGFEFYTLFASSLLTLPFIGWFLACSAAVKKAPFLWAVLPFLLIPLLEQLIFRTQYFVDIVYGHFPRAYSASFRVDADLFKDESAVLSSGIDPTAFVDIGGLLSSPNTWAGLVVAVGFGALAVYMRRTRTEADA